MVGDQFLENISSLLGLSIFKQTFGVVDLYLGYIVGF